MVIDVSSIPISKVQWQASVRVIRSVFPSIDLFEDIADPQDWPLLISAEQKTNPRLMESIGNIDLVPPARRVGGPGASYLMAPFTHVSTDRPSRFSGGRFGVLYVGREFQTALLETAYHHGRFMANTNEPAGWTSQFREIRLDVHGPLCDLRGGDSIYAKVLNPADHHEAQGLGERLHAGAAEGLVWPSVRNPTGECAGLFYPDLASQVVQGVHFDYHWNGTHVDFFREPGKGKVYRIV